jgi:hypothetical protein
VASGNTPLWCCNGDLVLKGFGALELFISQSRINVMIKVIFIIVATFVSLSLAYIVSAADPTPEMSVRHSSIVTPAADATVEIKDANPDKKSITTRKANKLAKKTPPADMSLSQLYLELR